MFSGDRRRFLGQASMAAAAWSVNVAAGRVLKAQSTAASPIQETRVYVDSRRTIAPLERNVFGSFLEHLGRAIYQGIYDPKSKLSDANGFRRDVLDEIRKMGVPIIRYPGGNFVSGYNWLDGVGPKQDRPRVLDKAWNTLETNQFGTNEFIAWCRLVGAEPLLAVNLGTGTPEQAAALVEYCNVEGGTRWSDLRRKHGVAEPYRIKRWCLGNEMDGPWQIGHMPATEYGMKAADAARQMRYVDPSVQLIACGSSSSSMPTYMAWDREILEQCYDYVDALSLHRYFENTPRETGSDSARFLAMNLAMDRQIKETAAVCDFVQGLKRSRKKLWLSFDEWNVWYRARSGDATNGGKREAPPLLEEVYNLEDALLVGGLINTLMRNADRVKVACLAQLVNVIAPLRTNADSLLRQTICFPYNWVLQFARGKVLDLLVESPVYEVSGMEAVPYLDVAGTYDQRNGQTALFILNRDLSRAHSVEVNWQDHSPEQVVASWVISGNDLKAANTFDAPQRITPQSLDKPVRSSAGAKIELPACSYAVVQWSV